MEEISTIPHAKAFVDKSETPYDRLLVWTWLPEQTTKPEPIKICGTRSQQRIPLAAFTAAVSSHGLARRQKYPRRGVFNNPAR
jgi:hypothetical protein